MTQLTLKQWQRRAKDGRAQHPGADGGLHSQQEGDQVNGDTLDDTRKKT